jgi:A/G-specific adenine glycosylase
LSKEEWVNRLLSWSRGLSRDLPWREEKPRDPYHVWVSEIMLQQTRTEAVKPYFNSWMERFPSIASLAEADEADVLHAWQGLGYYSRARNLHRAAQEVVETYGGRLPETRKEIEALPGIGAYTAGAILSMAMGQKESAIDGNVLRIYARLYDVEQDVLKSAGRKAVAHLVEQTLPEEAGDFNEALMDLGQEVCIPRYPKCQACPLASFCRAHALGREMELPIRTPKKAPEEYYAACAIIRKGNAFLLHQRPSTGMLASMWEFPMFLSKKREESLRQLKDTFPGTVEGPVWHLKHVFSHRVWYMNAYLVDAEVQAGKNCRYASPAEYRLLPLAGPHARLAAWAEKLVHEE